MLAPFEAPRLKIARARAHIEELRTAVEAYLAAKPVIIVVEHWKHSPGFPCAAWTARIKQHVPPILAVMIGDVVHNLRTALDLTANDLVRRNGLSTKGVYFPFADAETGLNSRIKDKNFHRAGPDAVTLLKAIRPYRGGNDGLRGLHDLDVADKHQALIPILGTAVLDLSSRVPGADDSTKAQLKRWSTKITHDGQELIIMQGGWGPEEGTVIEADYVLWTRLNPADENAGGHEVVGLMSEFARIVESIVTEFEKIT